MESGCPGARLAAAKYGDGPGRGGQNPRPGRAPRNPTAAEPAAMPTPSRQELENMSDRARLLLRMAAEAWYQVFGPSARAYWYTARDQMPMRAVHHRRDLKLTMVRRPRVRWEEYMGRFNADEVAAPPPSLPEWTRSVLPASPASAHETAYLLAQAYIATVDELYPPHRWRGHIKQVLRYAAAGQPMPRDPETGGRNRHIWWDDQEDPERWWQCCQQLQIEEPLKIEPIQARLSRELEAAITATWRSARWGLEGQRLHVGEQYVDLGRKEAQLMAELIGSKGEVALEVVMHNRKGAVWAEPAPRRRSPDRGRKMDKVNKMLQQLRNRFADAGINLRVHLRGDQIILDGDRELLQRLCT